MLHIAIDIRNIGRGRTGSEVVVRELTRALLRQDHTNTYYLLTDVRDEKTLQYISDVLELAKHSNARVYHLPAHGRGDWVLWHAWRFVRQKKIDVFHTEYIVPFFLPSTTAVITHIHDVSFVALRDKINKKDLFFLDLLLPRSLRRADKIIAVSDFTKREITKYYPTVRDKVVVIYNALPEFFASEASSEDVARVQKKYHLPQTFFFAIGTMQPRKNIPFLLEAFASLLQKIPDAHLVLSGRKTPQMDTLITKHLAQNPQLKDRVIFTGFIAERDLPAVYKGATVFVYPSLYEGFGLPILEAFSQQTITLASDLPVHHEIADNGAMYFDPHNVDQCSKVMYDAYTMKQTRHVFYERMRVRLAQYSWKKSAQLFYEVIVGVSHN